MMKIDNSLECAIIQFIMTLERRLIKQVKAVDIGIILKNRGERFPCEVMYFRIRQLRFQTTDHRRRQDDIADGGKAEDEEFWHLHKTVFREPTNP